MKANQMADQLGTQMVVLKDERKAVYLAVYLAVS
jgi:hypothetical protein